MSRSEFDSLNRRVEVNTAAVSTLGVVGIQLQQLTRDVAKIEVELKDHRGEHLAAEQNRINARRWVIAAFIAIVAAVDGPVVSLYLAAHGGH